MKYSHYMASPTELLDRLLSLSIMLNKDMATWFGEAGLTEARTHLLWELHLSGPVTQQALASALQVSPRNVTSLVDALVASGHVTRERHPDDRRAFLITLTDQGKAFTEAMEKDHARLAQDLFGSVSARDRAATERALEHASQRLTELFETHYGKEGPS